MTPNDRQGKGRELDRLQGNLARITHGAEVVAKLLETLYSLAYDRGGKGDDVVVRTSRGEWYLDEVGSQRAKRMLTDLMRATEHAVREFEAATASAMNMLTEGPGADVSLRGTLLSEVDDDGQVVPGSAKRALDDAVEARRRRRDRGEFSPEPSEKQPGIAWRG